MSEDETVRRRQCGELVRRLYSAKGAPLEELVDTVRGVMALEGRAVLLECDCVGALLVLLVRQALIQAAEGCSEARRDRLVTKAAELLWAFCDEPAGRAAAMAEDAGTTAIAALVGCPGWHLGQRIGCVFAGILAETHHQALVTLVPLLERTMKTGSTHELQLSARAALSVLVYSQAADPTTPNSIAETLGSDTLIELMSNPPATLTDSSRTPAQLQESIVDRVALQ